MRSLQIFLLSICTSFLVQCNKFGDPLVSESYADSLIANYSTSKAAKFNNDELNFWQSRIKNNKNFDHVSTQKYASQLVTRFGFTGDIQDLKDADSIVLNVEKELNNKEAYAFLTLVHYSILQHRFLKAKEYLEKAKALGIKDLENYANTFDVEFELGNIKAAKENLEKMKDDKSYAYQFRKSKMAHYEGDLDASTSRMEEAAHLAGDNAVLQSIALSNVGDLYNHAGKLDEAFKSYKKSLKANSADLHSMMGIGMIAMMKDNNEALAEKIFKFVQSKSKSPDALYKMILLAQHKQDKNLELKYATEFETIASNAIYENMYHKYLIQIYTESLKNPAKAEMLAKKELETRATPQTYSWYAFALMENNKLAEANEIYNKHIKGQPLEALELYYMGRLMEASKKGYNAKEYYKAADENKYDLSPALMRDLEDRL
ncbi:tetratricopeptide repeat protein [Frigoriflavimonas asaccharolytica]|uniref:Tetratricopeptide repeat protein n=1 Tax=Frigoriflavimonas asaccharolytica TaxID=2735899 RepID=A0A8J8G8B8_9FLAO|nr:hypothetical protein [Frigoriflavimonas asaccharolytica]NRS93008.1 hypothetical protein [Frigoriflavimonas asaccharolytica]